MPGFINAYGGKAFDSGCAWVDESIFGAALWLPPGEGPDEEELGSYHPDEPHWFLPLIAVDPMRQGQGVGSELMKHAVARCDETETRAYLESSNPQNVSLYERHGFKIVGEVRSGDCPVFTAMLRDAR